MNATPQARRVLVWTLPVRIAHWSVAALVLFDLFEDSRGKLHRWLGYTAAAVVALRLLYGLIDRAGAARLHWPAPREAWLHWREMRTGRIARVAGHNPLGAAMALVLWTLVLLLALTGWIARTDRFWGEDWPVDLHAWLADALLACVILHLLGAVAASVLERQNLIFSMVSGHKHIDTPTHSRDHSTLEPR